MTFLDLFAGIGGFRRGLERSGHTCAGHVEIDSYANKSYMAMYGLTYCPYGISKTANSCRMCRAEVCGTCEEKTCKGEWYAKDIKQITVGEIPRAEIWTFGFPCTDLSVAGRMAGLHGARSGLFFTVIGLLKSLPPEHRPGYLVAENVKHLVYSEAGGAFTTVLSELWEAGYDCEWQVVNSKDFGVPQHRERVYLVGYLGGRCRRKILPVGRTNETAVKRLVGKTQGNRIYDPSGLSVTLTAQGGGIGGKTGLYAISLTCQTGIEKQRCTAQTLAVCDGSGLNRDQNQTAVIAPRIVCNAFIDMNENGGLTKYARCIKAKQNAGIVNHSGETSGILLCMEQPDCVRAVINPEKGKTRQNGRRIKEDGEPGFTITCQDRHGVLLCCCDHWQRTENPQPADDIGKPLRETMICCRVRRLTPRECWRLQAFDDELFEKVKAIGMSDSQLYKQAGNAVTVNIVYEIGLRLRGGRHEV